LVNQTCLSMNKIFKFLILSLSISVTLYALVVYSFLELGAAVHPGMKSNFQVHPIGIYLHIFASLIALTIGPFQFNEKFRTTKTHLHRFLGKVYLLCVLIGGLSGLYMAQFSFGGMISHSGFFTLGILWLATGYKAYHSIKNKNVQAHQYWMFINFALTFAAVTLRTGLGIGFASGTPFEVFYPYLAWLCWVPNLLVALVIAKRQ
jgi:uncharacterized membrane protein